MPSTIPTEEQIRSYAAHPDEGPVVMINLLRFRERAEGGEETGRAAYQRYARQVAPLLAEVGGRALLQSRVDQVFIGSTGDEWDAVLVVQYPSRAAFLRMIQMPAYQEAARHRAAGLERTVLLASTAEG